MKQRDLANLLNRAIAALQTPDDLTDDEYLKLIEDLEVEAIRLMGSASCN